MHKKIVFKSKEEYRIFLKSRIKKGFDIRDSLCAREIISLIKHYKIPLCYKIFIKDSIRYIHNYSKYCNILLYIPMLSEVRIWHVIKTFKSSKKYNLFIPKIREVDFKLVKYRLALSRGRFGIKESNGRFHLNTPIHIAVIPVLGVDNNFLRIGFGKGMYDRFFCELKTKPYNIFVSRRRFIAANNLGFSHDIAASVYVGCYK